MELHQFSLREREPFEAIPGLDSHDVNESLLRLFSHGLIDGEEHRSMGFTTWAKLRVTASGWIVRGEWPDLDRVATAASMHRLLRALSDKAPDEERGALRRSAGVVARTGDDVIRGTAIDIAATIGREIAEG
jgi:hypothetical protein